MAVNILILVISFLHSSVVLSDKNNVRLVGDASETGGRVEIYYNELWTATCDDNWTISDATVVCRQLGLGIYGLPVNGTRYTKGKTNAVRIKKTCTGSEETLDDCNDEHIQMDCKSETPIVAVLCNPEIRLKGLSPREGVVELFSREELRWKSITDNSLLDHKTATKICHKLGLGAEGFVLSAYDDTIDDEMYGSGFSSIFDLMPSYHSTNLPVISCIGDIDPCVNNACSSNGVCTPHENGYVCVCHNGFTGDNCGSETSAIEHSPSSGNPVMTFLLVLIIIVILILVGAIIFLYTKFYKEVIRPRKSNAIPLNPFPGTTNTQCIEYGNTVEMSANTEQAQPNAESVYECPDMKSSQDKNDVTNDVTIYDITDEVNQYDQLPSENNSNTGRSYQNFKIGPITPDNNGLADPPDKHSK